MFPLPSAWRRRWAESLERGRWRSAAATCLAELWARAANPVRPVRLPLGGRIVGIGGATLGGSYKTPLVLALAEALVARGPVAVVAAGYPARGRALRVTTIDLPAAEIGDEAALLARALAPLGVPVVVAGRRSAAIREVASDERMVLVDGLLQARPRRVNRSLLVLDAENPWGAGRCPPVGDLRARRERLLEAADAVVLVSGQSLFTLELPEIPVFNVESRLRGALGPGGTEIDLARLRQARLGLWLAVARPDRILATLEALGVHPRIVCLEADHGFPSGGYSQSPSVDAWLTSAKCATKLGPRFGRAPVWVMDHRLAVDRALLDFVAGPWPKRPELDGHAAKWPD